MAATERGLVTPEAVVLEFDTAGIASRSLARAIDAAVQAALLLAFLILASVVLSGEGAAAIVVIIIGVAVVVFGYPILCEVLMRGQSPGKAALGLRVVTVEGAPISPRHAFIRSALGLVDFLLVPGGMIAVLVALFSPRSQRLGDVFAGTMVLRERTAASPSQAVWFNPPAGLEGYAATLDVSRVSPAQFGLVRSFLLRLRDLSPEARASLSVRLAGPLTVAMAHQAPPGVYADQFLQCVAAAYQRRHAPVPASPWGPPPVPGTPTLAGGALGSPIAAGAAGPPPARTTMPPPQPHPPAPTAVPPPPPPAPPVGAPPPPPPPPPAGPRRSGGEPASDPSPDGGFAAPD